MTKKDSKKNAKYETKKDVKNDKAKSEVKVEVKKLPGSEAMLSFCLPAHEFEKHVKEAAKKIGGEIKVSGFRTGKIPRKIVEKEVGEERVLHEGAELAIRKVYVDAILDQKVEAIGEPKIDIKKIAKGSDFEFTATVGVMPEVKLSKWEDGVKKINKEFAGKKVEVKDEEIDKEVEFLANQRAKIVTVNREAKDGDQLEVDFQVFQDNVAIEGGTAEKHQVVIGEGKFIPGFEEQLVGMKADEEKEFTIPFPKEYHAEHLAGKDATFKVKVRLVQERQVPGIDDKFASGIGKFKTLKELKDNIKDGVTKEREGKQSEDQKTKIIESIVEKIEIEVPEILVTREVETMMAELEADVSRMGMDKKTYFEQLKTTEEKMKEEWRKEGAAKRVKATLILKKLAEDNSLAPTSKEIEEQVNKTLEYYAAFGDAVKNIDEQRLYESVKGRMANEKVFEWLMKM